jgi:DNA-binding protein HU-beta
MIKTDLINALAEKSKLSKKDSGKVVDTVFATIEKALASGDDVALIGFGTFEVRERAARKGCNPQTVEGIEIAASKQPAFKPGKHLKMQSSLKNN